TAETRPNVTRAPNGLPPTANTGVPTSAGASPHSSGTASPVGTWMTARSPSMSAPATVPVSCRPSANVTVTVAPRRLWALVTTSPGPTTTPAPRPNPDPRPNPAPRAIGPNPPPGPN